MTEISPAVFFATWKGGRVKIEVGEGTLRISRVASSDPLRVLDLASCRLEYRPKTRIPGFLRILGPLSAWLLLFISLDGHIGETALSVAGLAIVWICVLAWRWSPLVLRIHVPGEVVDLGVSEPVLREIASRAGIDVRIAVPRFLFPNFLRRGFWISERDLFRVALGRTPEGRPLPTPGSTGEAQEMGRLRRRAAGLGLGMVLLPLGLPLLGVALIPLVEAPDLSPLLRFVHAMLALVALVMAGGTALGQWAGWLAEE